MAAERVSSTGWRARDVVAAHPGGERIELSFPLPGLYNVYNAVAAAAPRSSWARRSTPCGAVERRRRRSAASSACVDDRDVSILLVKNPAGANEVLRTLTLEDGQLDLWLALNDKIADGRDVSWIWDADFELLAGRVRRATCSGTRAEEMALRLKYAGIDAELDVDRDLGDSLDAAIADGDGRPPLFALPTYTALLELRDLLADRGVAGRWSD